MNRVRQKLTDMKYQDMLFPAWRNQQGMSDTFIDKNNRQIISMGSQITSMGRRQVRQGRLENRDRLVRINLQD